MSLVLDIPTLFVHFWGHFKVALPQHPTPLLGPKIFYTKLQFKAYRDKTSNNYLHIASLFFFLCSFSLLNDVLSTEYTFSLVYCVNQWERFFFWQRSCTRLENLIYLNLFLFFLQKYSCNNMLLFFPLYYICIDLDNFFVM